MYAILLSAVNVVFGFLLRGVIAKFFVFFALFFITTEFIPIIGTLLPNSNALASALGGIPASVWYFLDLFNLTAGLPILLSAWVTRFVIRRLPVIG